MRKRWARRCAVAAVALALTWTVTGCSDDDDAADDAAGEAASFCTVQPRFAQELNMALANADPDARQATAVPAILDDLEPTIDELRDAEPDELGGVVDDWVDAMRDYADGAPVDAAEEARGRMQAWVDERC